MGLGGGVGGADVSGAWWSLGGGVECQMEWFVDGVRKEDL